MTDQLLSPEARAAALTAATKEAHRRANAGTTTSLTEHVKAIVEAALDAAVEAEHCPYPDCIVVHRNHPGRHVSQAMVDLAYPPPHYPPRKVGDLVDITPQPGGGFLVSTPRDMPLPEDEEDRP